MKEVAPNVYVGTTDEARQMLSKKDEWRVVNVAKTLHLEINGWSTTGKYSTHPHYIVREESTFISVNWVDGPAHLFNYQNNGVGVVRRILAFIQKSLEEGKKVIISCDQGMSRSPSVAMVYIARVLHTIPDTSLADAEREFIKIYPFYQPAPGIRTFLTDHWAEF